MSRDPWAGEDVELSSPAKDINEVTTFDDTDLGSVRCVSVSEDVFLDIVTPTGPKSDVLFHKGYNPIRIRQITAKNGNARVWVMT